MPPSLELQGQFGAVEPKDGLRHSLPGNVSEDRVMRPAGVGHLHFAGCDVHVGLSPDKMAKDLLGVALFKAPELLGQHAVKGIGDHLYTRGMPDPDLLIRTGGEMRVSNFLLWQIAYTEIFVTSTLWPDFSKEEYIGILRDFQKRERRFGKTGA